MERNSLLRKSARYSPKCTSKSPINKQRISNNINLQTLKIPSEHKINLLSMDSNNHQIDNNNNNDNNSNNSIISSSIINNRHSFSHSKDFNPNDNDIQFDQSFVNRRTTSFSTSSNPTLNQERRSSSFNSQNIRRSSFLSQSMISNEKHLIYQLNNSNNNYYYNSHKIDDNIPIYSISLKESQGFTWNQDLFASQYQQESSIVFEDTDIDDEDNYDENVDNDNNVDENDDGYRVGYSYNSKPHNHHSMNNDNGIEKIKVIDINIDDESSNQ